MNKDINPSEFIAIQAIKNGKSVYAIFYDNAFNACLKDIKKLIKEL